MRIFQGHKVFVKKSGLIIRSSVFPAIRSFFVSKRAIRSWKRANCSRRSFVLYRVAGENRSICSLKKSKWVKSDCSDLLLGIKKGTNCQKHTKNTKFSSLSLVFLRTICSNHKRIIHIAHEQMSKFQPLKKIVFKFFFTVNKKLEITILFMFW